MEIELIFIKYIFWINLVFNLFFLFKTENVRKTFLYLFLFFPNIIVLMITSNLNLNIIQFTSFILLNSLIVIVLIAILKINLSDGNFDRDYRPRHYD